MLADRADHSIIYVNRITKLYALTLYGDVSTVS